MGLRQTFHWSIVGGSGVRSEKTLWHRVAVKELCAVSMRDILRVLESDFKEHKKDKKVSQGDHCSLKRWKVALERLKIYITKCLYHLKWYYDQNCAFPFLFIFGKQKC